MGLFEASVSSGAPVAPASIRYLAVDGEPLDAPTLRVVGWFEGEPFLGHALRLASHHQVPAEVTLRAAAAGIPPTAASSRSGRKPRCARCSRELLGAGEEAAR